MGAMLKITTNTPPNTVLCRSESLPTPLPIDTLERPSSSALSRKAEHYLRDLTANKDNSGRVKVILAELSALLRTSPSVLKEVAVPETIVRLRTIILAHHDSSSIMLSVCRLFCQLLAAAENRTVLEFEIIRRVPHDSNLKRGCLVTLVTLMARHWRHADISESVSELLALLLDERSKVKSAVAETINRNVGVLDGLKFYSSAEYAKGELLRNCNSVLQALRSIVAYSQAHPHRPVPRIGLLTWCWRSFCRMLA